MEDGPIGLTGLTAIRDLTNKPELEPAPIHILHTMELSATESLHRRETHQVSI